MRLSSYSGRSRWPRANHPSVRRKWPLHLPFRERGGPRTHRDDGGRVVGCRPLCPRRRRELHLARTQPRQVRGRAPPLEGGSAAAAPPVELALGCGVAQPALQGAPPLIRPRLSTERRVSISWWRTALMSAVRRCSALTAPLGSRSARRRRRGGDGPVLSPDTVAVRISTIAGVCGGSAFQSGSAFTTSANTSASVVPPNALCPVSISNTTQPYAQMSARLSTPVPRVCSGLM